MPPLAAATLFAGATPRLRCALVAPQAVELLRSATLALCCPVEWLGFEVRLEGRDCAVDLGVRLAPATLRAALADSPAIFSGDVAILPAGRRLADFLRRWPFDPELVARLPFVFLEFDAPADGETAAPSVFAALDWSMAELADWPAASETALAGVRDVLVALRGAPMAEDHARIAARCLTALPSGGVILHVAAMLSRPGAAARLSVAVPRARVPEYLDGVGWPDRRSVVRLLDRYAAVSAFGAAASVQLDFDVSDPLGPSCGITLKPAALTGWPALLDALVSEGLCASERAEALVAWPGADRTMDGDTLLLRDLSHVKVTAGREDPAPKAYFGLSPSATPFHLGSPGR